MDESQPMEATVKELAEICEAHALPVLTWQLSCMGPSETLTAHVKKQAMLDPMEMPGPHQEVGRRTWIRLVHEYLYL